MRVRGNDDGIGGAERKITGEASAIAIARAGGVARETNMDEFGMKSHARAVAGRDDDGSRWVRDRVGDRGGPAAAEWERLRVGSDTGGSGVYRGDMDGD